MAPKSSSRLSWVLRALGFGLLMGVSLVGIAIGVRFVSLEQEWRALVASQSPAPLTVEQRAEQSAIIDRAVRFGYSGGAAAAATLLRDSPESPEAWALWISLSSLQPGPGAMSLEQSELALTILREKFPDEPYLPAARAWAALRRDAPPEAALLGEITPALPGAPRALVLFAAMRARLLLEDPLPKERLRELLVHAPGHREACVTLADTLQREGRPHEQAQVLDGCLREGPPHAGLLRARAELSDALGESQRARDLFHQAGADLHAAAISFQEQLVGGEELLAGQLSQEIPPVFLHLSLAGALLSRTDWLERGARGLQGATEPPLAQARAAALLALNRPREAVEALGQGDGYWAELLRGRALADQGQFEASRVAFRRATELAPGRLEPMRAWAAVLPTDLPEILERLRASSPVNIALLEITHDRDRPSGVYAPEPWPLAAELQDVDRALLAFLSGTAGAAEPWSEALSIARACRDRPGLRPNIAEVLPAAPALSALCGDPNASFEPGTSWWELLSAARLHEARGDLASADALLAQAWALDADNQSLLRERYRLDAALP